MVSMYRSPVWMLRCPCHVLLLTPQFEGCGSVVLWILYYWYWREACSKTVWIEIDGGLLYSDHSAWREFAFESGYFQQR